MEKVTINNNDITICVDGDVQHVKVDGLRLKVNGNNFSQDESIIVEKPLRDNIQWIKKVKPQKINIADLSDVIKESQNTGTLFIGEEDCGVKNIFMDFVNSLKSSLTPPECTEDTGDVLLYFDKSADSKEIKESLDKIFSSKYPKYHTYAVIENLAEIGKIDNLLRFICEGRPYKLHLIMYADNLQKLTDIYGSETWKTITDNVWFHIHGRIDKNERESLVQELQGQQYPQFPVIHLKELSDNVVFIKVFSNISFHVEDCKGYYGCYRYKEDKSFSLIC